MLLVLLNSPTGVLCMLYASHFISVKSTVQWAVCICMPAVDAANEASVMILLAFTPCCLGLSTQL